MTIIERVALAIWQARMGTTDGEEIFSRLYSRDEWIACFRAAIGAMRDPTEEMYCRGDGEILAHLNSEKFIKNEDTPAVDCWRAMIDAALDTKECPV